jgi:ribosomal protein S18 acetylase RimI-like enzyme
MSASQLRVVRASPGLVWRALDADQVVGVVTTFLRPDNRWLVSFGECRDDAYGALIAAVAGNTGSDLYATVDDTDDQTLEQFGRLGFTVNRRESNFLIPTDPEITGLHATAEPDGVVIISAVNAYEDQLRLLDDGLRQDVPGTAGWKWDPGDFHEETFDSQFDPATYLVAVDAASGEYMGLARVWASPGRPRLGLIAVLSPYRRRGLASLLLARAFGVLHQRGKSEVTAEVDDTNAASRALLLRLGARRVDGSVELVRRR